LFPSGEEIHEEQRANISKDLEILLSCAGTLNARLTAKSVERLINDLKEPARSICWGDLGYDLATISVRLNDELEARKLLSIEDAKLKYYDPVAPLFGNEFAVKFVDAAFELDEGAKCFALGRSTACVFHLMRVMEIGIRAISRCLGIPDPTKPAERNWGHILKHIWDDGIVKKWPIAAVRSHGDGAFFESIHASLDAVKNPWRNATMHVENKYTDDEAEHIFVAVRGFMTKLASRCDENGEPKA